MMEYAVPPETSATAEPPESPGGKRRQWMRALALAPAAFLENAAHALPSGIGPVFLRAPETGLVMLEARAGSTGRRFNLGEMLVTRCAVQVTLPDEKNALVGHAYVSGNRPDHARLAALFDALLQSGRHGRAIEEQVIVPLQKQRAVELRRRAREAAPTRVDFFTLVRGEDA